MNKAKWMGHLTIGMLLSTAGIADEIKSSDTTAALSAYAADLQLRRRVGEQPYAKDWRRSFVDVEFQDNSALGRVSKIRNLSLLTLAKSQRTRLFLGINDDGLVGLHFIAMPKYGDRRFLSLARMPYLKKDGPDSRFE
jgi:hypothetical protein